MEFNLLIIKMALSLVLYPLEVLVTNRVLKTPLIKETPIVHLNMAEQVRQLFTESGLIGLYRGFIP